MAYLWNINIGLQSFDTWKIQLTIAINVISSKDVEEELIMHSRSNNTKFMSYNNADEAMRTRSNNIKFMSYNDADEVIFE